MKKDNAIAWLNSLEITNYEIIESPKYEFVINVNTNVDLNSKGLKTIEYKFGIIKGFFNCNYNLLESLENAPDIVQGNFSCGTNMLNSLLGAPKQINGYFNCTNNKIQNLQHCPSVVEGDFYANHNEINVLSLNDLPTTLLGNIHIHNNNIPSFWQNIYSIDVLRSLLEQQLLNQSINTTIKGKNYKL